MARSSVGGVRRQSQLLHLYPPRAFCSFSAEHTVPRSKYLLLAGCEPRQGCMEWLCIVRDLPHALHLLQPLTFPQALPLPSLTSFHCCGCCSAQPGRSDRSSGVGQAPLPTTRLCCESYRRALVACVPTSRPRWSGIACAGAAVAVGVSASNADLLRGVTCWCCKVWVGLSCTDFFTGYRRYTGFRRASASFCLPCHLE